MFCGIIDYFSPTTSFSALCKMGAPFRNTLPSASAYVSGGVGLFSRSNDPLLTFPLTRRIGDRVYTLMTEGETNLSGEQIIFRFANEGERLFASLKGDFSLTLYDSGESVLYILRSVGGSPIYFSGDIRLVFATDEKALAAFPERLYGISRLHEGTLLRYDIQGVRLIKK